MHGTNGKITAGIIPVKIENKLGIMVIPIACLKPKKITDVIKRVLIIVPTIN